MTPKSTPLTKQTNPSKINTEANTATEAAFLRDAQARCKMNWLMAKALVEGRVSSTVLRYAEQAYETQKDIWEEAMNPIKPITKHDSWVEKWRDCFVFPTPSNVPPYDVYTSFIRSLLISQREQLLKELEEWGEDRLSFVPNAMLVTKLTEMRNND